MADCFLVEIRNEWLVFVVLLWRMSSIDGVSLAFLLGFIWNLSICPLPVLDFQLGGDQQHHITDFLLRLMPCPFCFNVRKTNDLTSISDMLGSLLFFYFPKASSYQCFFRWLLHDTSVLSTPWHLDMSQLSNDAVDQIPSKATSLAFNP